MQKIVLTIIAIVCIAVTAQAQENKTLVQNKTEEKNYKHSIRLLPLPTLFGWGVQAEYERVIKSNLSLNIQAIGEYYTSYIFRNGLLRTNTEIYEMQVEISGRYYLSKRKNAPKGWFVSPGIIGGFREVDFVESTTSNNQDYNTFLIGGSVKSGYQWIFKSGFTLGTAGGINTIYKFSGFREWIGPGILLEFSIGYSW